MHIYFGSGTELIDTSMCKFQLNMFDTEHVFYHT